MKLGIFALGLGAALTLGSAHLPYAQAAGGVAIAAAAAASSSGARNVISTVVEVPEGSDGYIRTKEFYLDGPRFRFCKEDSRVVADRGCIFRQQVNKKIFFGLNLTTYKRSVVPGMTAQELLDARFGPGTTEETRFSILNEAVFYLFYRAKDVN